MGIYILRLRRKIFLFDFLAFSGITRWLTGGSAGRTGEKQEDDDFGGKMYYLFYFSMTVVYVEMMKCIDDGKLYIIIHIYIFL